MIGRLLISIGIFAAGYYLGKQYGLTEHIRKDLTEKRNQKHLADKTAEKPETTPQKTRKKQHPVT
jgi:hypothetical protein